MERTGSPGIVTPPTAIRAPCSSSSSSRRQNTIGAVRRQQAGSNNKDRTVKNSRISFSVEPSGRLPT